MTEPLWKPDEQAIARANMTRFVEAVRRDWSAPVNDYVELHEWSVARPEQFWAYVVDILNICFDRPPQRIVDLDTGAASPDWLVGAHMNIAESCFSGEATDCASGGVRAREES